MFSSSSFLVYTSLSQIAFPPWEIQVAFPEIRLDLIRLKITVLSQCNARTIWAAFATLNLEVSTAMEKRGHTHSNNFVFINKYSSTFNYELINRLGNMAQSQMAFLVGK